MIKNQIILLLFSGLVFSTYFLKNISTFFKTNDNDKLIQEIKTSKIDTLGKIDSLESKISILNKENHEIICQNHEIISQSTNQQILLKMLVILL